MTSALTALATLTLAGCASLTTDEPAPATTARDEAAIRALVDHIEDVFAAGDLDAAVALFTDDAMILPPGEADIIGAEAIRATYAAMLAAGDVQATVDTDEIEILGDLAYERGSFRVVISDATSGDVLVDSTSRHIHIFRRGEDGDWRTWRLMTNAAPTP